MEAIQIAFSRPARRLPEMRRNRAVGHPCQRDPDGQTNDTLVRL